MNKAFVMTSSSRRVLGISLAGLVAALSALVACGVEDTGSNQNQNNQNQNNQNTSPVCGDSLREGAEVCDGTDLGGATCTGLGYASGELACTPACTLDESGCVAAQDPPVVYRTPDPSHEVCSSTPSSPCTLSDMSFVQSEYGTTVTRADDGQGTKTVYRLIAIVEREGPANIDVFVVGPDGADLEGVNVAFSWPDAPEPSRPDEWYPQKVTAVTGVDGRVGFMLSSGAYLPCCGCGGPHAIWVSEPDATPETTVPSDLVDHLGMLGGTNHRHLDLLFQRVDPPPAEPPQDAVRCPLGR